MKKYILLFLAFPVVAHSATVYQVAPYGTNTTRNTFPYGTAPVGAECDPVTITQSSTGSVKHHYLKGQSAPTGVLAPCVPVTVADPLPPPPAPPPAAGMPVGIPDIGAWYSASPVPVSSITSGTAAAPTIYDRTGMPEFVGNYTISCSYCIVKGAKVKGTVRLNGSYIVFRDSEAYGYVGGNNTIVSANGNNIVITKNYIHDNGDSTAPENDVHGAGASNGTRKVWILENRFERNSGDGVQVGHGHTVGATGEIYVGRNSFNGDKENAVDFKIVDTTVISENTMTNYRPTVSSEGAAIVLHYCNHNSRVLNNVITDVQVGVSITSKLSVCTAPIKSYVIGNTIDGVIGNAIQMWDGSNEPHIENNIIKNSPVGIDLTNCPAATTVTGNQFTNVTKPTVFAGASCKPVVN